jgi:hypothetical protein
LKIIIYTLLHLFGVINLPQTNPSPKAKPSAHVVSKKNTTASNQKVNTVAKKKQEQIVIETEPTIETKHQFELILKTIAGKWLSKDDPMSYCIFSSNLMVEGYSGLNEKDTFKYQLLDIPCNGELWADPNGVFIKKITKYKLEDCFKIVQYDRKLFTLESNKGEKITYSKYQIPVNKVAPKGKKIPVKKAKVVYKKK